MQKYSEDRICWVGGCFLKTRVVSQDGMGSRVASAYAERLPPKASWCSKTEGRAMELGGGKRRSGETMLTKDEFGRCPPSFAPFVLPSSNRSLLVGQYQ